MRKKLQSAFNITYIQITGIHIYSFYSDGQIFNHPLCDLYVLDHAHVDTSESDYQNIIWKKKKEKS